MKCPDCKENLAGLYDKGAFCPKCDRHFSPEEVQNIYDAEMITEDTRIWAQVNKALRTTVYTENK